MKTILHVLVAAFCVILITAVSPSALPASAHAPRSPIKHLIVIVGENHTFDNLFGAYRPAPGSDQTVMNLLSEEIINPDGSPGPRFASAAQWQARVQKQYSIAPDRSAPYAHLPQPNTTYAFGQKPNLPDVRFPVDLPNGPFQLSRYTAYQLSYTGDPSHRFFQMWQQYDEGRHDLFVWDAVTIGFGNEGKPPPAPFTDQSTHQGAVSMGFYNMSQGDAPVFKFIADHYAMSDNFHQAVMGGTGASFIFLGTADIAFYDDGDGHPLKPPQALIEDPDPWAGSNNWYKRDGYESGSYVNCADPSQPGVAPILVFLRSLGLKSNCTPGHYYLVNNYGPPYNPDGSRVDVRSHPYTLPPQTLPNIAEELSKAGISWKYYIGGLRPDGTNDAWCSICNPMQFSKAVMTTRLRENIVGIPDFYRDAEHGTLPAVSFVRPYEPYSGHPANSAASAYEYFVMSIANTVIKRTALFADTAILVTLDEGGGYYDSGYIQPLDFFGDGTRIPLMVISPYVDPGTIDHRYADQASILKFIEWNWRLGPLSPHSRDNLPDPLESRENPYIPINRPAIDDLRSIFDFTRRLANPPLILPGGV
ncbi:MAG: alkaline phosphatase family protein [Candidatus Binataceae bacterium]